MSIAAPAVRVHTERTILLTLAAVQFTHVLDFMIMMPLGAELMQVFNLTPGQFSRLVAAYGASAAVAGLAGGFFLDRIERRRALLIFYAGFILATLACALAPTHASLLAARILAGIFGGLAGSLVVAVVGDVVPPERRGRGMAFVMSAFPLASIAGVPLGILLANRYEWHAPFFLLVALGLPTLAAAARLLPSRPADPATLARHPFRLMRDLLAEPIHWRGFAVTAALVAASGAIIPFMAPSLVTNVGITADTLPWIYFCGGLAAFVSTPLVGRLTDRHDKLHVLAVITIPATIAVFILTRLGPTPLWLLLPLIALFFVGMSGRFGPASTLVINSVEPPPSRRLHLAQLRRPVRRSCRRQPRRWSACLARCRRSPHRLRPRRPVLHRHVRPHPRPRLPPARRRPPRSPQPRPGCVDRARIPCLPGHR